MPITELLRNNARSNGDGIAIVEVNPRLPNGKVVSRLECETAESYPDTSRRREI